VILQAGATGPILPPHGPPMLVAALAVFAAYMVYEVIRWCGGNRAQLTPGQFRRRLAGGFVLEVDLVLWLLADPLLAGRPAPEKLVYLLFAMLLVFVPLFLAVRETAFIARQYVRWRAEVVRNLGRRDLPPEEPGK